MNNGEKGSEMGGDGWSLRWDPRRWREGLLSLCIRSAFYGGILVYIPSLVLAYKHEMWGVVWLDTVAMILVASLFVFRSLAFRIRAFGFLLVLYALTIGMLIWVLPVSGVFMMGYSVFATLLMGRKAGYIALLFNFLGMMAVGAWVAMGKMPVGNGLVPPTVEWVVITANFMIINSLIVIAIGAVINTLEKAWLSEQRALDDAEESDRRFSQIARNIQEVFYIQDAKSGGLVYASPLFGELWGQDFSKIMSWEDLISLVHPEDAELVKLGLEERRRGQSNELEFRIGAGSNAVWVRDRGYPVVEADELVRVVGTMREFTEQKQLQEELFKTQRLESIGNLASGIAHDLNNVLSPILMSVDVLKSRVKDPELKGTLAALESSAKRGAGLIRQILGLGKGASGAKVSISPAKVVDDVRKIVQETFPRDVELVWDVQGDVWNVMGDEVHLQQIVMNFLVNARDAVAGNGTIQLTLQNSRESAGDYVELRVKDDGHGIPEELQERIFEPFFSTKGVGKGTGLGLSTTYSIVKQMGGEIELKSKLGEGTQFSVRFPATREQAFTSSDDLHSGLHGCGELVLLVDDDEQIVTVTKGVLEEFGYRVITGRNGAEGVSKFAMNRESISVIVTDMNMPVMNGPAMIRAIKALKEDVKVIGVTGLRDDENSPDECHRFLNKPFSSQLLLANIRELIDESIREIPGEQHRLPSRVSSDELDVMTRPRMILIVEDELILGELTTQTLRKAGHNVTWVKNGQAALEELDSDEFDLVISDIHLPQLNGAQLFEAVHEKRPDLKFIFTTGDHKLPENLRPYVGKGVAAIYKPFTVNDLKSTIFKVLDS